MSENLTRLGPRLLTYEKVTATKTLDLYDSGKILLVHPADDTVITLPTLTTVDPKDAAQTQAPEGWNIEIWITEDTDGSDDGMNQKVNIDLGAGNDVVGMFVTTDDTGDYAVNNDDFIGFSAAASPGDNVFIWTDGNRWYVRGVAKATGSDVKFHTDAV